MSDPFVAEIKIFAGNFAPKGWALCNGQLLSISQNTALFSLLGTTYGGDGRSTFALPNLQGQAPVQQGQGAGLSYYQLGQVSGTPTETLLANEMPAHNHNFLASTVTGTVATSSGQMLSAATTGGRAPTSANIYSTNAPAQQMLPTALGFTGGNQPHNNMMPYQVLNFIIALRGVFPPRP